MANKKFTELPSTSTPSYTDIVPVVTDPASATPTNKIVTLDSLRAKWVLLYTNDNTMTDWTADVGSPSAAGGIITLDAVTSAYHYMHCNPLGSARSTTTNGNLPVKVTFEFRVATIGADQRLGCLPWVDTNGGPLYYWRYGVSGAGQQDCATENHNATTYRVRIPNTLVAANTWRTMTVFRDFGKVGGMLDGDTYALGDMSGWTTHIDNPRFYIVWYGNNTMEIKNFKIYSADLT